MSITFYHSKLCPRCARVRDHLLELLGDNVVSLVESVEIIRYPIRTWQDGIRMIPALKIGDTILSGVLLSRQDISSFFDENHGIILGIREPK